MLILSSWFKSFLKHCNKGATTLKLTFYDFLPSDLLSPRSNKIGFIWWYLHELEVHFSRYFWDIMITMLTPLTLSILSNSILVNALYKPMLMTYYKIRREIYRNKYLVIEKVYHSVLCKIVHQSESADNRR